MWKVVGISSEDNPSEDIHVMPVKGKEHIFSRDCWCKPEIDTAQATVCVFHNRHLNVVDTNKD